MQSLAYTGSVLIHENDDISGKPLWLSLTLKALKLGFDVKILMFADIERNLKPIFIGQCPTFVDCLSSFNTVKDVENLFNSTVNELSGKKSLIVIDTLTPLIRKFGINAVTHLIGKYSQKCSILTRFGNNNLSELDYYKLYSISSTMLVLSRKNKQQICKTLTIKKDYSLREKVEEFEINSETGNITSKMIKEELINEDKKPKEEPKSDFSGCGHVGNIERIKKEKANVILPFTRAQKQEGIVGLNANRKTLGAKIEYFADKEDDLDDSDPDEELMY